MNIFHSQVKILKNQEGFTLMEIVVVLALFLIITGVTIDLFVSIVQQQKRVLSEQELLNQTSYITEYISRALKMAIKDPSGSCLGQTGNVYVLTHCPNGTFEACNGVKFINASDSNACEEIFLDTTNPTIPVLKEIKNGASAQNILSDKFNVQYARFVINGDKTLHLATDTNTVQPRITLLFDVRIQSSGIWHEKIIQTTASSRNLIN